MLLHQCRQHHRSHLPSEVLYLNLIPDEPEEEEVIESDYLQEKGLGEVRPKMSLRWNLVIADSEESGVKKVSFEEFK